MAGDPVKGLSPSGATIFTRRIALAGLIGLVMLAACEADPSGLDTEYIGTYQLATVNGSDLPLIIAQSAQDKLELMAGSVLLNADATFATSTTLRLTEASQVEMRTIFDGGSYTVAGLNVRFNYFDETTDSGVLDGRTLTLVSQGMTYLFRR